MNLTVIGIKVSSSAISVGEKKYYLGWSSKIILIHAVAKLCLPRVFSKTFGANFESDGRLTGNQDVKTITCDTNANTCQVQVPAPGFALVFLTDSAFSEVTPESPQTFPTTSVTKTHNTVTIDPSVLATSNGHNSDNRNTLGSTSKGSISGAASLRGVAPGMIVLLAMGLGAVVAGRGVARLGNLLV
jgi:hypothetical protein